MHRDAGLLGPGSTRAGSGQPASQARSLLPVNLSSTHPARLTHFPVPGDPERLGRASSMAALALHQVPCSGLSVPRRYSTLLNSKQNVTCPSHLWNGTRAE